MNTNKMTNFEKEKLIKRMSKKQLEANNYSTFESTILCSIYSGRSGNNNRYAMGTFITHRFGLNARYLSSAYLRGYKLNMEITKVHDPLYSDNKYDKHFIVLLPDEVIYYIIERYYSIKLTKNDNIENFDYVFEISKNCKIGFFK
ncbi:hypothetical protein [Aliarcobacter cryaerophilus]|uniref:hypothetical protein n=1 Tax=Aliarcobacter cryaerophilus TaxID=28198 RepID=UPI0021B25F86|nr:hypothetical protein [Aliarcobacter cryaerophilus]MCT7467887.1 hypothetical protein [Aliarcobacter cryaerophilus]